MELFLKKDIKKYQGYFNNTKVIESTHKIFDAIKSGNELSNDDEKMASVILACIKLNEYYNK